MRSDTPGCGHPKSSAPEGCQIAELPTSTVLRLPAIVRSPLSSSTESDPASIGGAVRLKPGREKKIKSYYPWVQREEVSGVTGDPESGALVTLESASGEFLGIATYDKSSRFTARLLSREDLPIDGAFFERKLRQALSLRDPVAWRTNAYRALFAEADGVPGLIVDRYAGHLAVQIRTLAMDMLKPVWLHVLQEVLEAESIYERSEMAGRKEESLEPKTGPLSGETPDLVEIEEAGLRFLVPIKGGLKTGFYLDQRDNRRKLGVRVQAGEKVLDLFCYTGAFSAAASRSGASVLGVDILPETADLARQNLKLNGLKGTVETANAFEYLESAEPESWDWILLDPPAIAKARDKRDSLKWAVWKLVFNALPALRPGGRMLVCSCSYQMGLTELGETARLAANDRGCRLIVEDVSVQPPDHPYLLQFPESLYLKCLWLRKV